MDWPDNERRTWLEDACRRYQAQYQASEQGRNYLRGRALNPAEVATSFRIGLVSDPLPEHRQYRGRLVLPVLKEGTPVQLLFRCISPDCKVNELGEDFEDLEDHGEHPKALGPKGERRWLFNTDALMNSSSDEADICEGEWDPIALESALGLLTFGIPGAKRWKKSRKVWSRYFEGFRKVRFWEHPDSAGGELFEQVKQDIPRLERVSLPRWDVNKTLRLEGAGYLMEVAGL